MRARLTATSEKLQTTLHSPMFLQVIWEPSVNSAILDWPVHSKGGDGKKYRPSLMGAQVPVQT